MSFWQKLLGRSKAKPPTGPDKLSETATKQSVADLSIEDRKQIFLEFKRLRMLGREAGLLEESLALVQDRNNRPVYTVVRYVDPASL